MKKNNNQKNKTLDQLQSEYDSLKIGTSFLAGILIVLFAVTIYSSISEKRFDPLLITAIALSVMLPINYKKIKSLKAEIDAKE